MSCASSAFNDLIRALHEKCQSALATGNLTTTGQQVEKILSAEHGVQFDRWYVAHFLPALADAQQSVAKSVTEATKHKEFAELFRSMINDDEETHFTDKAFQSLNKAILWVPHSERHFLFDCFAYRSNLHYRAKDYASALADIEHALTFRASLSCMERKIDLLKHLNRGSEAYTMVAELIASRQITEQKKVEQLRKWKAELKQYKSKDQQSKQTKEKEADKAKPTCYIAIDGRMTLHRDEFNKRCGFKATGDIKEGVKVVVEQPAMSALMPSAAKIYCANCLKDCRNTFWPCPQCPEVIFCSNECAQTDVDHKAECGITGLVFTHLAPQAMQVYRTLARQGPEDLISTDQKIKLFPCKKLVAQLPTGKPNIDQALVQQLFASTQAEIRYRLAEQIPTRAAVELSNAILLLAMFMAKNDVDRCEASKFDDKTVFALVRILSLELAKVEITEYGWHEEQNGEKVRQYSFQCLIGSRVGHACKPNAEWGYDQKAQRFVLKTTRPVKKGDAITISYGCLDSYNFIERQSRLQHFTIMCACDLCTSESRDHFALRCKHCNGAIPYEERIFPNNQCMRCEAKHSELSKAKVKNLLRDFKAVRSTVVLLGEAATEPQMRWVEKKMANLTVAVDLYNHQLLAMISGLCDEYIRRKQYGQAVEWYQWLVNGIEVHLCTHTDSFVHFTRADRWASAYTAYLEQLRKKRKRNKIKAPNTMAQVTVVTNGHLEVAESLYKRMFSLLELLNVKSGAFDERIVERDEYEQLIQSLNKNTQEKYHKFKSIAAKVRKSIRNPEEASSSKSESGDEASNRKAAESSKGQNTRCTLSANQPT